MERKNIKEKKTTEKMSADEKSDLISYRLKCTKTANGLSHYLMYGDVSEDKALL